MQTQILKPKQNKGQKPLGRFKSFEEASEYKVGILNKILKNIPPEEFEKLRN